MCNQLQPHLSESKTSAFQFPQILLAFPPRAAAKLLGRCKVRQWTAHAWDHDVYPYYRISAVACASIAVPSFQPLKLTMGTQITRSEQIRFERGSIWVYIFKNLPFSPKPPLGYTYIYIYIQHFLPALYLWPVSGNHLHSSSFLETWYDYYAHWVRARVHMYISTHRTCATLLSSCPLYLVTCLQPIGPWALA